MVLVNRIIDIKKIIIVFLLMLFGSFAYAQSMKNVYIELPDSISADSENELISGASVRIVNNSDTVFVGSLVVRTPQEISLISNNNITILLKPHQSIYLPVKMLGSSLARSGSYMICFLLYDAFHQVCFRKFAPVAIPRRKLLLVFCNQRSFLFTRVGDSIRIPITLQNDGNIDLSTTFVTAFPRELTSGYNYSIPIPIRAFSDTSFFLAFKYNSTMRSMGTVNFSVTCLNSDGTSLTVIPLIIQFAKSKRRYRAAAPFNASLATRNYLSFSSNGIGSSGNNISYAINGFSSYLVGDADYRMNINTQFWRNGSSYATMLYNSYVEMDKPHYGFSLGSIDRTGEMNLDGRGAELRIKDSASTKVFSLGMLEKNTNLLGSYKGWNSSGSAGWMRYRNMDSVLSFNSALVYDNNKSAYSKNFLWDGESYYSVQRNLRYHFKFAMGYVYNDTSLVGHYSTMVGAGFSSIHKNLTLTSENLVSTRYYPGTQKGAINLLESISWKVTPKDILWASFNNSLYTPSLSVYSWNDSVYHNYNRYGTQTYSLGFTNYANSRMLLSFYAQHANQTLNLGEGPDAMHDWLGSGSITYNLPEHNEYFSLSGQFGQYNFKDSTAWNNQMKASLNYTTKYFSFFGEYQRGIFLLSERTYSSSEKNYEKYNFYSILHFPLFKNMLTSSWSAGYYFGHSITSTLLFSGNLSLSLNRFSYNVTGSYYKYSNGMHAQNIQMGLTWGLPGFVSPTKKWKSRNLHLFLFKDCNSNGRFDFGDSVAIGQIVYIGGTAFLTDRNGEIFYKGLPGGNSISIEIPSSVAGWYAPIQYVVMNIDHNLNIPLTQAGSVYGSISILQDKLLGYYIGTHMNGIIISATSPSGQKTYTQTDSNGNFFFFLPAGSYLFSVDKMQMPSELECKDNDQTVFVSIGRGSANKIHFTLRSKIKKLNIKHFGS